jgi:GntR family transcriptional repressor for pyruvate dehydrogenase complex
VVILSFGNNESYFTALKIVGESSAPIGAWRLSRLMQDEGLTVSEATAGRLLRSLEDNGHVRPEGRGGRVITPEGKEALREWLNTQARSRSHNAFVESLRIRERQELIDVLIARRAIETETAYLAAQNVTERDIRKLERIVEEHENLLLSGGSGVEKDVEFHRALAEAGKNRVLMSALDVIHHDPQVGQALEYIRSKIGSRMVEDHRRILAQVKQRDKEGARQAMVHHIASVIRDVDKYWAEIAGPQGGKEDVGQRPDS